MRLISYLSSVFSNPSRLRHASARVEPGTTDIKVKAKLPETTNPCGFGVGI